MQSPNKGIGDINLQECFYHNLKSETSYLFSFFDPSTWYNNDTFFPVDWYNLRHTIWLKTSHKNCYIKSYTNKSIEVLYPVVLLISLYSL